jgi:hypothetical protein
MPQLSNPGDALETKADRAAQAMLGGRPAEVRAEGGAGVLRQVAATHTGTDAATTDAAGIGTASVHHPRGTTDGDVENSLDIQMGRQMIAGMARANQVFPHSDNPNSATGIWYPFNFERAFAAGTYSSSILTGFTDSTAFLDSTDLGQSFVWQLKPIHSASKAIQSWLPGLTIADCASVIVALEFNTLRPAIGDDRFDRRFGSDDSAIDDQIPNDRLRFYRQPARQVRWWSTSASRW